jgi:uncharacterized protein YggE
VPASSGTSSRARQRSPSSTLSMSLATPSALPPRPARHLGLRPVLALTRPSVRLAQTPEKVSSIAATAFASATASGLQSGLNTMRRNWSENDPTAASSRTTTTTTTTTATMSAGARAVAKPVSAAEDARARRKAAIQAALDEMNHTSQALKANALWAPSIRFEF